MNYTLPKEHYLAFDGKDIRDELKNLLVSSGVYTDARFEGSNISAFTDMFGMIFSQLLFSLHKSSVGGTFSETDIYKNMNRIVSLVDYSPVGFQTSHVSFSVTVDNLSSGSFIIPKYCKVNVGGYYYSTVSDIFVENGQSITLSENILFQGDWKEKLALVSNGEPSESFVLNVTDTVDHNNVEIYVKSENSTWRLWNKTNTLFLSNNSDQHYTSRLNGDKQYEFKFGDGINGKALSRGDKVLAVFLSTNLEKGEIGASALDGKSLSLPAQRYINELLVDSGRTFISQTDLGKIRLANSCGSSFSSEAESVEQIRKNAPVNYTFQNTLTTSESYRSYILSNFNNVLKDCVVLNNKEYQDLYLKFFYENIGIGDINKESRSVYNNIKYSDSCFFNNVYCFLLNRNRTDSTSILNDAQKNYIVDAINYKKCVSANIVPMDPVYRSVSICFPSETPILTKEISSIKITVPRNQNRNAVKDKVNQLLIDSFDYRNRILGEGYSINTLVNSLLGMGITSIKTVNTSTNEEIDGIYFVNYNPVHAFATNSAKVSNSDISVEKFEYLYSDIKDFANKIIVE